MRCVPCLTVVSNTLVRPKDLPVAPTPKETLRRFDSRAAALLFALATSIGFVFTRPPVGDFWAAQARQSAASHGVGLKYWFSWFGGTVPGHYSVVAPAVSRFVDVGVLGAVSTVAIVALCHVLLRESAHPVAGLWAAAIGATVNLWSGRVPFAFGTAVMLVVLLAVRYDRRWLAAGAALATALTSPVSAAILLLGLTGVFVHDQQRRAVVVAAGGTTLACSLGLAVYFGLPGPETFRPASALLCAGAIAVLFLARPPAYLRTDLVVALVACALLAIIPNGMGSNFERLAWLCLPIAVVATAQARLPVVLLAGAAALGVAVGGTAQDLYIAAQPQSRTSYYNGLVAELDRISGLQNYRVEVVPDGTHVAAYALLDHAILARGYETQSDNKLHAVLSTPTLDAITFKTWLDNNAVGYVVLDRNTLQRGPEDQLVRSGSLPYLHEIWSDNHLRLFAVSNPSPVAAPPARVIDADQASLTVYVPQAGRVALRLRWSRFLKVAGAERNGARLEPDGFGWTKLVVIRAGEYVLTG